MQTLSRYAFPGNVRELENLLHRALALAGGEWIDAGDLGLPDDLLDEGRSESQFAALETPVAALPIAEGLSLPEQLPGDLAGYLDAVERAILLRALEQHRFNRTAAAASLGLSLRQIRYRMARLAISAGDN
jgi:two-component system, NtrC family, response regulator PilR